ncbi:MAG TPA: NosD domain-containing protein, partial [Cryomorphaceae bacterium]|nr:NosD domain-containing protein [Cryomorphaceae bacterium]
DANRIFGFFEDEASAGNAIHAWKCDSLSITNNRATRHRDGIYFEFVDNSVIARNTSKDNIRYGLHFMFSNDDSYEKNVFESNGAGVAVMFSHNIRMIGNTFVRNWGGASYGLLLKEISDGLIQGNVFVKNTIGILAEGANRLKLEMNTFKLNGTALDIKGNCLDNRIVQNDFIANTFDVVTNTKQNNNSFAENYWSTYTGYDRNKDGFGDVAFRPVNLFAKITHKVPSATFLLQSPFVKLIEMGEKIFPQFIPESLVDEKPRLKAYDYD